MDRLNRLNPDKMPIVLVLQGGGALGAYQGGVYQALHEHGLMPDWIIGTSIGAVNAALIAGNPASHCVRRVKAFWDMVAHPDGLDMQAIPDFHRRIQIGINTIDTLLRGVPGFFKPRLASVFPLGLPVAPEKASFYDSTPLCDSLRALVDFDYMNTASQVRLTMTAVKVTEGVEVRFDSRFMRIGPDHVRASGSLPPGFAPVRIDGELYWDGGVYSNTPLESVLGEFPEGDVLCFLVDLWSPAGAAPTTLEEVRTRQKDVTYASRTESQIADYVRMYQMQSKLRELYDRLPADARHPKDKDELAKLGCESVIHIVRLRYAGHDWHMASKDINFSKGSIEWRWDQGYGDALRSLQHAGWLKKVEQGKPVVLHEAPGHDLARRQAD